MWGEGKRKCGGCEGGGCGIFKAHLMVFFLFYFNEGDASEKEKKKQEVVSVTNPT